MNFVDSSVYSEQLLCHSVPRILTAIWSPKSLYCWPFPTTEVLVFSPLASFRYSYKRIYVYVFYNPLSSYEQRRLQRAEKKPVSRIMQQLVQIKRSGLYAVTNRIVYALQGRTRTKPSYSAIRARKQSTWTGHQSMFGRLWIYVNCLSYTSQRPIYS
jgi:hypothetical protein